MDWQCPTCALWYTTSADKKIRNRHLRVHTGERPFDCIEPRCGESFAATNEMMDHYRNIHSAAASVKKFECVLCGCHYARQRGLEMHVLRAKHPLADPAALAAAEIWRASIIRQTITKSQKLPKPTKLPKLARFVCHEPRCGMVFTKPGNCLTHWNSAHTSLKKVTRCFEVYGFTF